MNLPMHGVTPTYFDPEPPKAQQALDHAIAASGDERDRRLRAAVAEHPTLLDGWARLAEDALAAGRAVEAYAYARVGYHRGLDRARQSGWGGQGPVPGDHPPNRGFLRSVAALGQAAQSIGEEHEAERCVALLAELDPDSALPTD